MKQYRTIYLILAILSVLIYANTLNHAYVLDDFSVIKENTVVKKGFEGISTIWKTHYRFGYGYQSASLYRPLPLTLFAIQWEIAPDTPALGHAFNILLYALLACIVFTFLLKVIGKSHTFIAFITSLLFIAHPIHTEVVANIKSIDDILAMIFSLLAIIFLLKTIEKPNLKQHILSLFLFLFAFFSKESTVSFLAIIPLILISFKNFSFIKAIKSTLLYLIPFAIYMIARFNAIGSLSGDAEIAKIDNLLLFATTPLVKVATAIKILGLYCFKLIFPHPLINDYSFNQIELVDFSNQYVWLSMLLYITLITVAILSFKKKPILSFSISFYLLSMVLYSNLLFTIGTSFGERLLFAPSLGFCLLVAYGISQLFKVKTIEINSLKQLTAPMVVTGIILSLYSFKTIQRNTAWKDNFTLYSTDVVNCSNSARCQYYYGLGLMKEKGIDEKNPTKQQQYYLNAIQAFNEAIRIYPGYADAWSEKGLAHYRLKNFQEAERSYLKAVQLNASNSITWSNLGSLYFELKQYQKAKTAYEKAIQYNPNFLDAIANYASTLGTLGDFNGAIVYFKKAIAINPYEANYYRFIGITYQNLGNKQQANFYLNKAKQLSKQR